jgi:hypothetical protein
MSKKAWLAGLAGGVAAYLVGWLLYGILLMDFLQSHTTVYPGLFKEKMNMITIALGCFVWSFTIAWVYSNFSGKKSVPGGVITGVILGLLIETGMCLSYLGIRYYLSDCRLAGDGCLFGCCRSGRWLDPPG